jgi:hypothetical protein
MFKMCYQQDSLTKDRPTLSSGRTFRGGVTRIFMTNIWSWAPRGGGSTLRRTGSVTVTSVHCEDVRRFGQCPSSLASFSGGANWVWTFRWLYRVQFPKCCVWDKNREGWTMSRIIFNIICWTWSSGMFMLGLECALFNSFKYTVSYLGHILGIVILRYVPLVSKCLNAPLCEGLVVVMIKAGFLFFYARFSMP